MTTTARRTNRILIIEEDMTAVELLKDYIAAHGWSAVTARSGDEALRSFTVGMFDLVLVDAELQGEMDSAELTQTLNTLDPSLNIAVMSWPACAAETEEEAEPEFQAPMLWSDIDALLDGRPCPPEQVSPLQAACLAA
jgi:CheY-like chemotaxis protein